MALLVQSKYISYFPVAERRRKNKKVKYFIFIKRCPTQIRSQTFSGLSMAGQQQTNNPRKCNWIGARKGYFNSIWGNGLNAWKLHDKGSWGGQCKYASLVVVCWPIALNRPAIWCGTKWHITVIRCSLSSPFEWPNDSGGIIKFSACPQRMGHGMMFFC